MQPDHQTCPAAPTAPRDPFADDVLERLARSNRDYQRAHGHYIVPLAERLLAARKQRDGLLARLEADPDRAAIAVLDGLQKLLPELLTEDVQQSEAILDWIGVADDLSLAERVRILALERATRQGYTLDEAERLCPPAFREAEARV